jgi:putative membrane protein
VTELLTLAAGCVTGLALFARLLDRILKSYRALAMAFLSGVLMGSLVAVWPWRVKVLIESGADALTVMRPVWPGAVSQPQLGVCVASFFAGLFLVWSVQRLASQRDV